MKSELDIFASNPIQKSILKTEEVAYKPISSLDNATQIEFVSIGHGDTYREPSSIGIRLKIQLAKADGVKHETADSPGVVNNILHSLFRQCNVYLNGKPISQIGTNYPHRAFLDTVLNYGSDAANTHLETTGWLLDSPGKLDSLTDNKGLQARKKLFPHTSIIEISGRIHNDFFNVGKLLINGVELRVVLTLEKPEFYIMEDDKSNSVIKILEADMYMNHVTINPSILMAHHNVLEKTNAVYPYKRVEVKSYTVPSGTTTLSLDNVVMGLLPNFLIFCMVDNDAYTGKRSKNPFNFKHNKLTNFNLVVNGVQVPSQPLEFDFEKKPVTSTRGYNTLFKGPGIHYFDKGHQITKEYFDNGCFMLAFDLTPDHSYNSQCENLLNEGNIRIEGRFASALPSTITCLVYVEFDATLEINKHRNVFTNF